MAICFSMVHMIYFHYESQMGSRDMSQGKATIVVPSERIGLVIGRG
jgi:hypothetical protein